MKAHYVRPWLLSGLLVCALLAGCSLNQPAASVTPRPSAPASATSTATPATKPMTLYLAAGEKVYALNPASGATRWVYSTGLSGMTGDTSHWINAIATSGQVVYFDSVPDNSLYALKASDGSLLWTASVPQTASNSIYVTPGAIIVASLFHQQPTSVAAFDPLSGKILWTQPATGPNALLVGSGVIYESYDASGPYYGKSGVVKAVNATTGAVVWQATGHNFFDLALTNNILYASGDDALHAFDAQTGAALWSQSFNDATMATRPLDGPYHVYVTQIGSTLYLYNGATIYALNGATHTVTWHRASDNGFINTLADGLSCVSDAQGIAGLDTATGTAKWTTPEAAEFGAAADSGICYFLLPAKLSAFDAQTGAIQWSVKNDDTTAQLMANSGVVYVLTKVPTDTRGDIDTVLHALNGASGSTLWTLDTHASTSGVMTLG